jgi:hypothetical protein
VAQPRADELLALSRKYETLAALRRERRVAAEGEVPPALRALAREFPGALRELDTLTLAEIDSRARRLSRAARAEHEPEPWMAWMIEYHRIMKAALFVKARLTKRSATAVDARELAAEASREHAVPVEEAFVAAVATPPGGRLNHVVFRELAHRFGESPEIIREALFPARRPGTSR